MKISEPKFLLKNPTSEKETLISLFVRFNGERVVYSTGESIHPSKWDKENQRVIALKKDLAAADINHWLDKIEHEVKHIFRKLKYDGIQPTPLLIKQELNKVQRDQPSEIRMTLFKYIEKYIQETKAIKSHSTYKSYKTVYNNLIDYSKVNKTILDFENIDISFLNNFKNHLTYTRKLSPNTIAKHIKILKVFLNAATEIGINQNTNFKSKKFRGNTEEVAKIYLNEIELDKIYNLDLSYNKRLDKVRDLFLVGCLTGLRFSDFNSLTTDHIEGDYIKIKTQKTGEIVMIPVAKRLKQIISKYNNQFPSSISNQKMNLYIKEIGELADIKEEIIVSKNKCGKMIHERFKKFELISSHCARRSFATNAYLAKIPAINIMKITGHRNESVFQKYIRFSNEENANALKKHEFFNR